MCDVVWYVISKIAINISIFHLDRIYAARAYYSASASACMPRTPARPRPYRAANGCGRDGTAYGDPTCGGRVQVCVTSRDGSNIIAGRSLTVARANGGLSDYVKATGVDG